MAARRANSLETILTFENRDMSQWSITWSTTNIPGIDNASGALGPKRRKLGRRRLRIGSLVLGAFLTMHCRVSAAAITGGSFIFIPVLLLAVISLGNPMRHFEVYLGQWSISGPGRAFRIIPIFDGIGIAICINTIIRAINCCSIAAIALLYVVHTVSDEKLPFTYCRDFDLKPYEPIKKDLSVYRREFRLTMESLTNEDEYNYNGLSTTVGLSQHAWRNATSRHTKRSPLRRSDKNRRQIEICRETYEGRYPALYRTPPYNYFYVELVRMREGQSFELMNIPLVIALVIIWCGIWALMMTERFRNGRLTWNKIPNWFVIIPWIWILILAVSAIPSLKTMKSLLKRVFRVGSFEATTVISDALEIALYIHSVGVGTETIVGKGLNYYDNVALGFCSASGHIDPYLDGENMWHSALLMTASSLHAGAAAICAVVDSIEPSEREACHIEESTLWILPMYSRCVSSGDYSHLTSTLIFGGLAFSYVTVAYLLIKTALHTIFEYRVKLVFVEQIVVSGLIFTCMLLSMPYATSGGLALLESVDGMSSVAVAYVCCLELVGLLCVYRSNDFLSDLNISMEDSACSSRISVLWTILPFLMLATLLFKAVKLAKSELPVQSICIALAPLLAVILAVPIRSIHNAIVFMRPPERHA